MEQWTRALIPVNEFKHRVDSETQRDRGLARGWRYWHSKLQAFSCCDVTSASSYLDSPSRHVVFFSKSTFHTSWRNLELVCGHVRLVEGWKWETGRLVPQSQSKNELYVTVATEILLTVNWNWLKRVNTYLRFEFPDPLHCKAWGQRGNNGFLTSNW